MAVHGRVRFPRVVRLRFWEGVRSGLSVKEAAAAAGVSRNSGWTWMAERGGVMPLVPSPGQIRPRLTLEQREEIAALKAARLTNSEIAREIGVHRSTIGRELAAGSTVFPDRHPKYKPSVAQAASEQRAKRDRPGKLATDPVLLAEVQARLEDEHSPE